MFGQAQKTGPGTAAVDVERILTYPTTAVSVGEGALEVAGADVRDARSESQFVGLVGETFVAAGAELRVAGDLQLTDAAVIIIGINGPTTDAANYGRLSVGGTLTKGGRLSASGIQGSEQDYEPTVDDVFPVISCTDCYPGSFDFFDTGPLDACRRRRRSRCRSWRTR